MTKIEYQRQTIKSLIAEIVEELPTPLLSMVLVYQRTIQAAIDKLTEEQIEHIVTQAKVIIAKVEGADYEQGIELHPDK